MLSHKKAKCFLLRLKIIWFFNCSPFSCQLLLFIINQIISRCCFIIKKKVLPSGQKFKAVIISSFAIRNPNLRPHKDIRDRAKANDEIPLISCITYHSVKWLGLKDIEIRNGMSIPHRPIVTSPAFPTELPSHSIFSNGSKWNSIAFPPSTRITSGWPSSCSAGYSKTAVNKPTKSHHIIFLTSFIVYHLLLYHAKVRLPLFKTTT